MTAPDPIVQALITARHARGLSQREVTRMLGTSSATMSMWERGLASPTLGNLHAWAAALGHSVILARDGG